MKHHDLPDQNEDGLPDENQSTQPTKADTHFSLSPRVGYLTQTSSSPIKSTRAIINTRNEGKIEFPESEHEL